MESKNCVTSEFNPHNRKKVASKPISGPNSKDMSQMKALLMESHLSEEKSAVIGEDERKHLRIALLRKQTVDHDFDANVFSDHNACF